MLTESCLLCALRYDKVTDTRRPTTCAVSHATLSAPSPPHSAGAHLVHLKASDPARDKPKAGHTGCFLRPFKQALHSDADAKERLSRQNEIAEWLREPKKKRQEEDEDGDGEEARVLVCEWDALRLMKVWLRGCLNQQAVKNEHGKESNRRECNSL